MSKVHREFDPLDPRALGPDWLVGGGEMGQLVRTMDWSATPLGPIEAWPQSLRTAVSLCLASNFPISLAWGPCHVQIYNDGYWPICGGKHPHSMGQDFSECWASAWPAIGAAFARALRGETSFLEDQRMFLDRNGYLEETFFTFSFSPIRDETGGVGGLFHPVTETTAKMLGVRRTRALRDLTVRANEAHTTEEALRLIAGTLSEFELDVPFALFYLLDAKGQQLELIAHSGAVPQSLVPTSMPLHDARAMLWGLADVVSSNAAVEIASLQSRCGKLRCGPYPEGPQRALALPITMAGAARPTAIMVAGVSARLPLNETYRAFFDLLATAVVSVVASARAYEEARQRAEALAAIDRAKTAFFSNVSHEFRTPLTLMLGPLEDELAEQEQLTPARRARLQTAYRNTLRLLKLVNTLLDFSRIEAGRAEAWFEPVDLAAHTAELASMFRSALERAGLALTVDCPALPEPVYVDRDMWEKVVLNLLSNAFKHTFEGGVHVLLSWEADHAMLSVIDTGVGIAAAQLPHLFDRFHRVKGAKSRTYEGTGIGLALVAELVQMHGGTVTVESHEGEGSIFTVRLKRGCAHLPPEQVHAQRVQAAPIAAAAAAYVAEVENWNLDPLTPAAASPPEPEGERLVSPPERRPHVLWADDNADMRDYVGRLLAERYELTVVSDGLSALQAAQATRPDLVLTDVMMPGMDGFGLLQALRADERTRTIPVILLSARAGEEAAIEGLQAGADDYLVKPFAARELLARVHTHLDLAKLRSEWTVLLEQRVYERTAELEAAQHELRAQVRRLDLLRHIARAIDERQDLHSILQVVVRALEDDFPVDFACACLVAPTHEVLTVTCVGVRSKVLALELAMTEQALITVDRNGLARCIAGELVYEQDIGAASSPFTRRLAASGLRALVAVPLQVAGETFGVLLTARSQPQSFGAHDLEFLQQLSEHVALAAHQAQLHATLQRAYDDLRRTQEAALQQERLRALGQMASGIAHDINNAISPVALYTDALLEREVNLSPRARAYLETIKRAIEDVAHTIERMREFYRKRADDFNPEAVDLNALVTQVVQLTRARWSDMPQRHGHVIEVRLELSLAALQILGVPGEIRESLTNLIFNAVDAMPEGGTLTLRTYHAEPPQGRHTINLEVIDSGVGMDEATRLRCLEPFFTTKGERGTGLGLAMVYGTAQRHGADVSIDSQVGRGTTVRLHFTPAQERLPPTLAVQSRTPPRLRILIIDDDPLLLDTLREVLTADGHDVVIADGGQQGIDTMRAAQESATPFSIIVTDLGMPHVDGRQVAKAVKAISPTTPVLLLTGWGQRLEFDGEAMPQVDRVLGKPPKLAELREVLTQLCTPMNA